MTVTPMLQLIGDYTGFTCLTLVGAKPKDEGPGVMFAAVHVGETAGMFPKNFGSYNTTQFERWSETFCEFVQAVAKSRGAWVLICWIVVFC